MQGLLESPFTSDIKFHCIITNVSVHRETWKITQSCDMLPTLELATSNSISAFTQEMKIKL